MPQKDEHLLEIMCFRQGKKGFDVLLRKEKTLHAYWHNFLSVRADETWTTDKAKTYFQDRTHIHERVRDLGCQICETGETANLYMIFLTEEDYSLLAVYPEEIMWVNSDVLLNKLVERPQKFKPELLEMVTTCLKELHQGQAIAV